MSNMIIADLKEVPHFANVIADRIWNAWWKDKGYDLAAINDLVQVSVDSVQIPFAHVAYDGDNFIGTASLIECDFKERPNLTPWIAALWIEPAMRSQGHARALLDHVAATAFEMGFPVLYLCARAELGDFYTHCGWELLEKEVGPDKMSVFTKRKA